MKLLKSFLFIIPRTRNAKLQKEINHKHSAATVYLIIRQKQFSDMAATPIKERVRIQQKISDQYFFVI